MEFPNGLKRTLALFSRAAYDVFNSDEIEKVKKHCSRRERKSIKRAQEYFAGVEPAQMNLWAMYDLLKECPQLLLDILAHMVCFDDATFSQEELTELFKT